MSERRGRRKPAVPVLPRTRVGYFLVARQGEERDAEHVEVECCGRVPSVVEQRPSMTCGEQHRQRTRNHAGFRQLVTDVSDAQRLCRQRAAVNQVADGVVNRPSAIRSERLPEPSGRTEVNGLRPVTMRVWYPRRSSNTTRAACDRSRPYVAGSSTIASARPSRLQAADREAETAAKPEHPVAVQIEARKRNGQRQDEQRDRSDHLMADQPAPG